MYVSFLQKKNNIPQNGTKLDTFRNDEMINELDILKKVWKNSRRDGKRSIK